MYNMLMCFAIPVQVKSIKKHKAVLENGTQVFIDKHLKVMPGDFVRLSGMIIVDRLSKSEGEAIRLAIKDLQTAYEN